MVDSCRQTVCFKGAEMYSKMAIAVAQFWNIMIGIYTPEALHTNSSKNTSGIR